MHYNFCRLVLVWCLHYFELQLPHTCGTLKYEIEDTDNLTVILLHNTSSVMLCCRSKSKHYFSCLPSINTDCCLTFIPAARHNFFCLFDPILSESHLCFYIEQCHSWGFFLQHLAVHLAQFSIIITFKLYSKLDDHETRFS